MAVIDINNIKTQIKSLLDAANTTTASTDLSSGLSKRVQRVLKIHPLRIPIEAFSIPWVTVFTESKEVDVDQITHGSNDRTNCTRRSELLVNVVGAVMNPIFTDIESDLASDEIEDLMENIEEILRANFNLNSSVKYHYPTRTTYYEDVYEEEAVFRAGVLELSCKVFY